MSARRILTLVVIAASLGIVAVGQDPPPIPPATVSAYVCSAATYPDGSPYEKNLNELVSSLSKAAAANGSGWFASGSVGAAPDQAWGFVMCFADSTVAQCTECLRNAPAGDLRGVCPHSRGMSLNYGEGSRLGNGGCVLRYAGGPILGTAVIGESLISNPRTNATTDVARLNATRSVLLSKLADAAAEEPLRFANGSMPYKDARGEAQVVYGLAQCTRDLRPDQCKACLAFQLHLVVGGSTAGTLKGFSCYTRFQLNQPIDIIPGALVPPAAPTPAPSQPPAAAPTPAPSQPPLASPLLFI